MKALSVIKPYGNLIVQKIKTLQIRSWLPKELPILNLVIIQNNNRLSETNIEEEAFAVAVVDVISIEPWTEDKLKDACVESFSEGYYAWKIDNVRPIGNPIKVKAKRKIYDIDEIIE